MVYICPGGDCTGIAFFSFYKVSHLKHPSVHYFKCHMVRVIGPDGSFIELEQDGMGWDERGLTPCDY